MGNNREWYMAANGGYYYLEQDDFGMATLWWSDLSWQVKQNYPHGFRFEDRHSNEFNEALDQAHPGIRRLKSLSHAPVIYTEEGWLLKGEMVDAGPRIWIRQESAKITDWQETIARGTEILACDTPSGTLLMGDTWKLMDMIYGQLSVDRDSDIFLGHWQEAARMHAAAVRALKKTKPGFCDEDALASYASDQWIDDATSRYRLAVAYFGDVLPAMEWIFTSWNFRDNLARFVEIIAGDAQSDIEEVQGALSEFCQLQKMDHSILSQHLQHFTNNAGRVG